MWIVGGVHIVGMNRNILSSSEIIKNLDADPIPGPQIPFSICCQKFAKYSDTEILMIGGEQNGEISNKTWIINCQSLTDPTIPFEIKPGPSILAPRTNFACATMNLNGKSVIVIAGGTNGESNHFNPKFEAFNTVEILDPSSSEGWKAGKYILIFLTSQILLYK